MVSQRHLHTPRYGVLGVSMRRDCVRYPSPLHLSCHTHCAGGVSTQYSHESRERLMLHPLCDTMLKMYCAVSGYLELGRYYDSEKYIYQ